mmetsp:Transcript_14140/g.32832  ORF Transcript_14140/g.32832 Transcript_14140/m.32832 type:complete len:86 (-) Transcript_14140:18-275(-)
MARERKGPPLPISTVATRKACERTQDKNTPSTDGHAGKRGKRTSEDDAREAVLQRTRRLAFWKTKAYFVLLGGGSDDAIDLILLQ